jgi:hypothetical protein
METTKDLEDSQKIFSKIANANRFFTNEGARKATEPSAPHSDLAQESSGNRRPGRPPLLRGSKDTVSAGARGRLHNMQLMK